MLKKFSNFTIKSLLIFSGAFAGITILFISIFLFKEGLGFFKKPAVEEGYSLFVNSKNKVEDFDSKKIKEIFDHEITNWSELGGEDVEILLFRMDNIFDYYSDEELGEEYEFLAEKLAEVIKAEEGIIAFVPHQYSPAEYSGVKELSVPNITPSDFFTGKDWLPTATPSPLFGTLPMLLGTLLVSLVAILFALPLGLGVAIYLSELAPEGIRKFLKPIIELLAGIPSVVYGFFGLVVLAPLVQKTFNLPVGETALTGSLILAIMALPTIISIAEDAMRNTPRAMKEASLALGATHWQTIYRVIIPYSKSGISAAVVLGIGRAIGETMAVLMVTGNAALMPTSLFDPVRTIPATIAAELGEAPSGGAHYQALFLLGAILFIITLFISIAAEMISKKKNYKDM
ncbi:MAG TPA: phosphate ABC transporter permease subunit PstC [Bacteroidales bacterium]|nr:phosphate ABC transporter permease subunit PstC [Bacteroidales bacterium]HOH22557.1 phosphate ABC transporter permease subunit PstC [Bacteroidales bacterium]HPB58027.1 phosphate ABC transporter permease subunit PstC [Bacteroidales bacterium]HPZ02816.1 phosphate ABC transporter permease subunit PstC [Bacteroidales bacterium]HQB74301.1 phosphate ABC transporter permease subunit PstC [Bacteroidales bacterium]